VLDYLEFAMTQTKLAEEGIAEMMGLRVMAVGVEPTDCVLVDEVVTTTPGYLAAMGSDPRTTST
jgi:hypothetical protein